MLGILITGYFAMAQAPFMLTYENHAHQGDQDFNFIIAKNIDVEISQGSNQVWDFSAITNSASKLTSFMLPSSKGLKSSSIPEANIIIKENNNEFYFRLNKNKMEQYGASTCNTVIKYDQPYVKLKFPFAYGESYSGEFSGRQIMANGNEVAIKGRYNVGIVGYGKLIMPNGQEVPNALLLKSERIHIYGTNEQAIVTYRWYVENIRYPVFVIIRNNVNGVEKTIQTAYHENIPIPEKAVTADILSNNSVNFMAFPNPYTNVLNVSYKLAETCKVKIELYDMSGKRVHTIVDNITQEEGIYNVEVTSEQVLVPAGIYYVKGRFGKETFEQKVVKTAE